MRLWISCSTSPSTALPSETVTLKPNSNLIGGGATCYFEISYQAQLWEVGGNVLNYGYIQFTTQ